MADYSEFVSALVKSGVEIQKGLDPFKCELLHMSMGISGESGELLDAIKKHVIYGKDLDIENVIEELGDLEFYLQGIRNLLELHRETIIIINQEKLNCRYHQGTYTDEQAINRKDKE